MRNAMTLIELIFAMVIISAVFSVIPKIIFVSNKSMELSMKEDALFNAYTLMGSINKLSWDEKTLNAGKILDTSETGSCSDMRVGGFYGSRNCIDSSDSASAIGEDGSDYNDIDDYHYDGTNGYKEDVSVSGKNRYELFVQVNYVDSNYTHKSLTDTKELKEIIVTVASHDDNKKIKNFQSSFFYHSANLGHIQIKKELWR